MRSTLIAAGLVAAVSAAYTVTETADVTITSCGPSHTGNCPYKPTATADPSTYEWEEWDPSSTVEDPATTTTYEWEEWDPTTVYDPATTTTTAWEDWEAWTSTATVDDPATTSTAWEEWDPWTSTATIDDPATTTTGWEEWDPSTSALCPSYTATGPPAWFSLLPTPVLSSIAAKWTGAPPADWCYYTYSATGVKTSTIPVSPVAATSTWYDPAATSTKSGVVGPYTGAANSNAGSFVVAGLAAAAAIVLA